MAFFSKRQLSPVERYETALKDKQAAREKLAGRVSAAETALGEKRIAAEQLAIAGAADAQLDRAEAEMRAAEDRAKTLRSALTHLDEEIATAERELASVKAQRDCDTVADELELMAKAIEQAIPSYDTAAMALGQAITSRAASIPEATRFATNVDAVRREVLTAAYLICGELQSTAARTRAGNTNIAFGAASEPPEIERQLVYTLNPLLWRENGELRRAPSHARVELPKALLLVALRHQHVDYLNARRVQTLMQIHGSGQFQAPPHADDPRLINLDVLAAQENGKAEDAA
jgi:hypothetical protein